MARTIAFLSDRSGEEQIWLVDHLASRPARQLTKGLTAMLYQPSFSPDGKWLAFGDKDGVLRVCEVATGELRVVADEPRGSLRDHVWSPCSGHLAFSMTGEADLSQIYVWTLASGKLRRVSRPLAHDRSPTFGPRGERLFFLGMRGFEPRLSGSYEWDFTIDRAWGIYALALRKDLPALFEHRSDEAVAADDDDEPGEVADAAFEQPIEIDFDGLADRVETVPVALDNYRTLRSCRRAT